MRRDVLSLITLMFCAFAQKGEAIEIKLKKPFIHRKKPYQEFDTKSTHLSVLEAMLSLGEEEAENVELIEKAIANQDFPHATNVVYFYPPLVFNNQDYYQYYIYGRGRNIQATLLALLRAAQEALPELDEQHRARYREAIRRIKIRLAAAPAPQTETQVRKSKSQKKKGSEKDDGDEGLLDGNPRENKRPSLMLEDGDDPGEANTNAQFFEVNVVPPSPEFVPYMFEMEMRFSDLDLPDALI